MTRARARLTTVKKTSSGQLALYVRTSTADQDGAAQLHQLYKAAWAHQAYCGRCEWPPREFVDVGHSGAKASRPALDRLRAAARAGEVSCLLVTALDRLGRNLADLLLLVDSLASSACLVVSLREGIDLTSATGRLMLQLFGALAEFERALIRERVCAGVARAREKGTRSGKPIGRPPREVNIEAVARMRGAGATWRRIAQHFRVPRRTLVRAWKLSGAKPWSKKRTARP
jgi:DNA invertase Pin-like site-specific DNA recombinase